MARRSPSRGFRPYRPTGGWTGLQVITTTVPSNSKVLLASFVPIAGVEVTLRRSHLSFAIRSDQSSAIESPFGAIGVAVFADTAIAAGVASLPDPVTDIVDDVWLLHQALGYTGRQTASGALSSADRWYDVSSKAMRKVPSGRSVTLIVANATTLGFIIDVSVRFYLTLGRG